MVAYSQVLYYKSIPLNSDCNPHCTIDPLPEIEVTFENLDAGREYNFEFWLSSNGYLSGALRLAQSTFTDEFTAGELTQRLERQASVRVHIESGVGSKIVFSYLGILSGLTGSYEKVFELVLVLSLMKPFENVRYRGKISCDKFIQNKPETA